MQIKYATRKAKKETSRRSLQAAHSALKKLKNYVLTYYHDKSILCGQITENFDFGFGIFPFCNGFLVGSSQHSAV